MATTPKKPAKKAKPRARRPVVKTSQPSTSIESLSRELADALEQQAATSELLEIIASSAIDVQPVLNRVAETAARLCGANDAVIRLVEGNTLRSVAHYGPVSRAYATSFDALDGNRGLVPVAAVVDRRTIHIGDIHAAEDEFPESAARAKHTGVRTDLATPLLRGGAAIGVIHIRRVEVKPFTEWQIALLKTFAHQAVIAIENARLFQELKDSLEQQTAMSEILRVIASSPTDVRPVLDAVAESAARLCESSDAHIWRRESDRLLLVAHHGPIPRGAIGEASLALVRGTVAGRSVLDGRTFHVADVQSEVAEFPEGSEDARRIGFRTLLTVPLMRQGTAIGTIVLRRIDAQLFTERQVALLETFADQAVIAIENVRLFNELKESLEQQTATSEILGVIASSPTDIQPVLDTVAKNAARLCESYDAVIHRVDGDYMRRVAHFGPVPVAESKRPLGRGIPMGRAIIDAQTIHIHDVLTEVENEFPDVKELQQKTGTRTVLAVPLLREGVAIGVINVRRTEVRPFSEKQITLLKTFADQAVIAIENVRLFQELQAKNREITEALEQQTATSEILRVIASSPTDIQPVLDAVAENAARLCDSQDAQIYRVDGEMMCKVARYGNIPDGIPLGSIRRISRGSNSGRAIVDRQPIHIYDMLAQSEEEFPDVWDAAQQERLRTVLAVPLMREDTPIGAIVLRRLELKPFAEKQILLLNTFADQAVIAIENVRLFSELQERNAELGEALEHQTATAEVLGIISRSPTDVQPVLDAIVESAARVCGIDDVVLRLHEGNSMVARAHIGSVAIAVGRTEINIDELQFGWIREHGTLHIPDVRARRDDFPTLGRPNTWSRTFLFVPLRQQEELIGVLAARRIEVRPFTPAQIKLLETFADQAVIAIENVRLFKELQERTRELMESVDEMKALSEVGQAVSSSLELETVLETIGHAPSICPGRMPA